MKKINLCLGVCLALNSLNTLSAADNLEEALSNGKLNVELKALYADRTNKGTAYNNENILSTGAEVTYVTDSLNGFRLGLTAQGNATPLFDDANAKFMFNKEWWATGFVLSETYLGYAFDKTDIKAGRQYVNMPLVAGNYTRAFKEAFEGVSVYNKDIDNTQVQAGWFYKFQGRSNAVSSIDPQKDGRSPVFKDMIVLGGAGPVGREFDNIFTAAIINQSVKDLKLTGSYARVTNVGTYNRKGGIEYKGSGNVDLFLAEANYVIPFDSFKLVLDAKYNRSRVDGQLDAEKFDGDMLGFRASVKDLYGFGLSYAYTTVRDKDSVIISAGNGGNTYTFLPIRGPFAYSNQAGMDVHKLLLEYDFSTIGAKGLKTALHYVNGKQNRHDANLVDVDIKGWGAVVNYAVKQVKGLSAAIFYAQLEREPNNVANPVSTKQDEIWLKLSYKFNIL